MKKQNPDWLKIPAPSESMLDELKLLLDDSGLHTVCESANCPNIGECFARRTCTFMILGNICTRNCRFCAVEHGTPEQVNPNEPIEIAKMVHKLGLRHVVLTTVTRDDLQDGGVSQFIAVINAIRAQIKDTTIEVLISDLKGSFNAITSIINVKPDIINHNIETVPRLYEDIRPQASYGRSLLVLRLVKERDRAILTKSGMMLGLGETRDEIIKVMRDLRISGCDILSLGQYLSPSSEHTPVDRFVQPDEFKELEQEGLKMGFLSVSSGPLVRSSYNASAVFSKVLTQKEVKNDNNR